MARTARRVVAAALALVLVTACDPAGGAAAPLVLLTSDGYTVKSPCGEKISKVEVVKVTRSGPSETYWAAESHGEGAVPELVLFIRTPGFSVTPIKGAMETGVDYVVLINDGQIGTDISPGMMRVGRGAWQSDTFALSDLAKEQAKVRNLRCPG
jgi:hypothetical protein